MNWRDHSRLTGKHALLGASNYHWLNYDADVFIVWFSKTLQNWKALVSTTVSDGMYYEITHNGDKKETYLDVYKKWENQCIADGNTAH